MILGVCSPGFKRYPDVTSGQSHDPVDPELRGLLSAFPQLSLSLEALPQIRLDGEEMWRNLVAVAGTPADKGIRVAERFVPGPPGAPAVRVLTYGPTRIKQTLPAYLHIHGGGYVLGTADSADVANRELAATLSCFIVSVDYRLAPETRAPGSVEDCYAALRWLHGTAAELRIDPSRIAIGGESAGGGLAAALALLARDRGEIPICFQNLVYPMLDDRTAALVKTNPHTGHHLWTHDSNRFGWTALLGAAPGAVGVSPYAAPARAIDLRGLPPALITVGALDLFLEEDIDYATRLMQAGVPTELHVYPGAYHGFDLATESKVAQAMNRDRLNALRRALAA
jgi:acetyl esterase/lipase